MKRLTLMRHAKSSREDSSLEDIDRPLSDLGRRQAPAMGAYLKERGLAPDLIVCSPSKRTRETLDFLEPTLGAAPARVFPRRLYNALPQTILAEVTAIEDAVSHALVIGHNPGINMLALAIVDPKRSARDARRRIEGGFKSGALAHFEIDIDDWAMLDDGAGTLCFYVTPKDLLG